MEIRREVKIVCDAASLKLAECFLPKRLQVYIIPQDLRDRVEVAKLEKKVGQGDEKAQRKLALRYEFGRGVEQDIAKAEELFLPAAKKGVRSVINELLHIYRKTENYPKLAEWYEVLANQEDPDGQYELGMLLLGGYPGVEEDLNRAVELFKKVIGDSESGEEYWAERGLATAYTRLGRKYRDGDGVEQDLGKALKYFETVASMCYGVFSWINSELGELYYDLGMRYRDGDGVKKNIKKANEMFKKAAAYGCKNKEMFAESSINKDEQSCD